MEQLADIQELNGRKDLSWLLSGYRRNIPWYLSVRMSPHTTGAKSAKHCLHWNVRMPCSPAKAGRVNSPLCFRKKRIKNNIPAHFGRFITLQKRNGSRNWSCHVLPPDISEMIFTTRRICPGLQQLSAHDDLPGAIPPVSGTWLGSTPEILLSGHGKEWHTVAFGRAPMPMQNEVMPTDWDKKNQESRVVADYIRRIAKNLATR